MFKRLKKAWELSKVPGILEADTVTLTSSGEQKVVRMAVAVEPIGDGAAVFMEDMTQEQYDTYVQDEVHGWAKFKKRLGL